MLLASIPSPPKGYLALGPLHLRAYGFIIACAVVVGVWLAQRRWQRLGGAPGVFATIAVWAVPGGIIGARLYSVVTSWQADTGGDWWKIFAIWDGGLGIWGGVAGGALAGLWKARRMGIDWRATLDCAAGALPLCQAMGRWGNYFNQELYGRPSTLPWAVKITHPVHCSSVTNCVAYPPGVNTFQPTFLYECIWDLVTLGLVVLIERKVRVRRGYLFAFYAASYTFGRFWTESLRVDEAHRYLGLRLNDWMSVLVFAVAGALFLFRGRAKPGDVLVTDPLAPDKAGGPPSALGVAGDESSNPAVSPSADDPAVTAAAAPDPLDPRDPTATDGFVAGSGPAAGSGGRDAPSSSGR